MNKYTDYEQEKQLIAQTSTSAEEYEQRIQQLTERLKV